MDEPSTCKIKITEYAKVCPNANEQSIEKKLVIDVGAKENFGLNDVLNRIMQGDCIEGMKKLPSEIADMVFIDPPYFLQLQNKRLFRWKDHTEVNGVNDAWDKFKSFEQYDSFLKNVLTEVKRIMKPEATVWITGTYHNIHRIGKIMLDMGFWILNDVIWFKKNPMPNWLRVRFTNATETLIWAVKNGNVKWYTFNEHLARKFSLEFTENFRPVPEEEKIGTNIWYLPLCTGEERLRDEKGKKIHSTQKPEGLLERVILTSTKSGDLVFDPMAGTGTTGYVASKLDRNFIMIEKEKKYIEAAESRFVKLWPRAE